MINMASTVKKEEYTKEWESTTPVDDKLQELGRILIKDFKGILEMSFASSPSGKWSLLSAQSGPELKVSSCFLFQPFLLSLLLYTGDPPDVRHGAALHLHGQTGLGSYSQVGQSVWP